jgi:hypothetical protein
MEYTDINCENFIFKNEYMQNFNKDGVLIFRNFFLNDPIYESYYNDLFKLCSIKCIENSVKIDNNDQLSDLITKLSIVNRKVVGKIYDLGTFPIKLLSGNKLKTHPKLLEIIKELFGNNSIIGFPQKGETLHIFPPGIENTKYNLPMHQDLPYILQSSKQITIYANMGNIQQENNGGIEIWLGSHKEGVTDSIECENNLRITKNHEYFENNYNSKKIFFDKYDLAIFDSLLQHRGIQNHSSNTRIVQLIRYSDLNIPESIKIDWASSEKIIKENKIIWEDVKEIFMSNK